MLIRYNLSMKLKDTFLQLKIDHLSSNMVLKQLLKLCAQLLRDTLAADNWKHIIVVTKMILLYLIFWFFYHILYLCYLSLKNSYSYEYLPVFSIYTITTLRLYYLTVKFISIRLYFHIKSIETICQIKYRNNSMLFNFGVKESTFNPVHFL